MIVFYSAALIFLKVITFTAAQAPVTLPSPDPITGTVQSTTAATGFLPDTGSNWFDRNHQSLDDHVGKPFIPAPGSPLSIYNKPEVLDPFYSKTNVFHHHHHFIIPVHKHVKHIHHHHHHHHTHPIAVHHHHHHKPHHVFPGHSVIVHHDHNHHNYDTINLNDLNGVVNEINSQLDGIRGASGNKVSAHHHSKFTSFDIDGPEQAVTGAFATQGHSPHNFGVDPSIADTVSVPTINGINAMAARAPEPVPPNVVTPGPLAEQTGYGMPNNGAHRSAPGGALHDPLSGYINTANNAVYGNAYATNQAGIPPVSTLNSPYAANQNIGNPGLGLTGFHGAIGTQGNFLPQSSASNGMFENIAPVPARAPVMEHSETAAINSGLGNNALTPQTTATDSKSTSAYLQFDTHGSSDILSSRNGNLHNEITQSDNLHPVAEAEHSVGANEVHHFIADSNGNELHEMHNSPMDIFSQGQPVTTTGDHGAAEAGFFEGHHGDGVLGDLEGHRNGEGPSEHVMAHQGAIHLTEDSHGGFHDNMHDHDNNHWNSISHEGSHEIHLQEDHRSHSGHPYAIHVSDTGHGYSVESDGYHDRGGQVHEEEHSPVEHVVDSDLTHDAGGHEATEHVIADHGYSEHGIIDHGTLDHEIIDHGALDHGIIDHGTLDHGIIDHGTLDHGINEHGTLDHGIIDHGAFDHGIIEHGMEDHGIIDHEIGDHGVLDHEIADHGIVDHGIADHHLVIEHGAMGDHGATDVEHTNHEIVDHGISNHVEPIHVEEVHDPGLHVDFHALDHGHEFHDGLDGFHEDGHHSFAGSHEIQGDPTIDEIHHHAELSQQEVGITDAESFAGHHGRDTHVINEHVHEVPHVEMHHDDHRDYHDGGLAPELQEGNMHSNVVPEYHGNNPATDLHDVGMDHDAMHDLRHGISAGHPALGEHAETDEFIAPGHDSHVGTEAAGLGYHGDSMGHGENGVLTSPHTAGVHGFDEHGGEFFINSEHLHHEESHIESAQKDAIQPGDHNDENNVHLDAKDEELYKKARASEFVDPPYLTHLDPHGDGFGEGVVAGPDLNVGNDQIPTASGPISGSFPALIPNRPPFVDNHPATHVSGGMIAPDYGSKRQNFEKAAGNKAKTGFISIGSPKQPIAQKTDPSSKGAKVESLKQNTEPMKSKLSKFVNGNRRQGLVFFGTDRQKDDGGLEKSKFDQTFETIPNEPRHDFKTVSNSEKQKEKSGDSGKIVTNGASKEQERNTTNSVPSNANTGEKAGAKVTENGKSEKVDEKGKANKIGTSEMESPSGKEPAKDKNIDDKKASKESNGKGNAEVKIDKSLKSENKTGENDANYSSNDTQSNAHIAETSKPAGQTFLDVAKESNETETKSEVKIGGESKYKKEDKNKGNNKTEESKGNVKDGKKTDEAKGQEAKRDKGHKANGKGEDKGETKASDGNSKQKEKERDAKKDDKKENKKVSETKETDQNEKNRKKKDSLKKDHDAQEFVTYNDEGSADGSGETDGKPEPKNDNDKKGSKKTKKEEKESDKGNSKDKKEVDKEKQKLKDDKVGDKPANKFGKKKSNAKQTENTKEGTEKMKVKNETKVNDKEKMFAKQEGEKLAANKEKSEGKEKDGKDNNQNLDKSKSKGKKGDESKEKSGEEGVVGDGDLGTAKGSGGEAENNPGANVKEKVQDNGLKEKDKKLVEEKEKEKGAKLANRNATSTVNEGHKVNNLAHETGGKAMGLQNNTKSDANVGKENKDTNKNSTKEGYYGLNGGPGDVNSYAGNESQGTKASEDGRGVKGDESKASGVGQGVDAGQGKRYQNAESEDDIIEKVGSQDENDADGTAMFNANAADKEEHNNKNKNRGSGEKENVSVDKEEWQTAGTEATAEANKNLLVIDSNSLNEESGLGSEQVNSGNDQSSSAYSVKVHDENKPQRNTGPTDAPTQFYYKTAEDGSGTFKTPTESVFAQEQANDVTTDKNSHELDGIAKSEASYLQEALSGKNLGSIKANMDSQNKDAAKSEASYLQEVLSGKHLGSIKANVDSQNKDAAKSEASYLQEVLSGKNLGSIKADVYSQNKDAGIGESDSVEEKTAAGLAEQGTDPLEVIESNTATVHGDQGEAEESKEEKELFGEVTTESQEAKLSPTKKAGYTEIEDIGNEIEKRTGNNSKASGNGKQKSQKGNEKSETKERNKLKEKLLKSKSKKQKRSLLHLRRFRKSLMNMKRKLIGESLRQRRWRLWNLLRPNSHATR